MRIKNCIRHTVMVAAVVAAFSLSAAEFQPIGSRAISMGGAGVASSRGPFAVYFNPALLARRDHRVHIAIEGGVAYREVNLLDAWNELDDVDFDDAFDALSNAGLTGRSLPSSVRDDLRIIATQIRRLADQNGVLAMPTSSLGLQAGRFGLGVFGLSEVAAHAVIDPDRLDIIVEERGRYFEYVVETGAYRETTRAQYQARSIEYALDEGLSYIQLSGVAYAEIPLAYAHQFETEYGDVSVGGAFKIMPGMAIDKRVAVDDDDDDDDDGLLDDALSSGVAFGLDAGVLFSPGESGRLNIGLVAKNINSPSYDVEAGGRHAIKPQVRTGVAYALTDWAELAVDLDLTENDTFLPGIASRFLGGGVSLHPLSWLCIRGGAMMNLAESDDGVIVTGGLGLGLKWFQLDLSGQMSTQSTEIEGTSIPRFARVQLALVSKWN